MKDLVGTRWSDLEKEEQKLLLKSATIVDARTSDSLRSDGEGIVDLNEYFSVSGELKDGQIIIDDDAEIYSPSGF